MLIRGAKDKEHAMSPLLDTAIAVIGIDIGKNSFRFLAWMSPPQLRCGKSGRVGRSRGEG